MMRATPAVTTMTTVTTAVMLAIGLCACAGDGLPPTDCQTAIDCDLGQACRGGSCVANVGEGEGEGEGADPTGDAGAVTALCDRVAACQPGSTAQSCIDSLTQQLAQMRSSPQSVCHKAADLTVELYVCAAGATCAQVQDSTQLQALCPVFSQAQEVTNQCQGVIVGEGEGEGEGEPFCPSQPFGPGALQSISLTNVRGSVDTATNAACSTQLSVSLEIIANGDASAVTGGFSSFDGGTVNALVNVQVLGPNDVTATACTDGLFQGTVAVQLAVGDQTTNAVCGAVQ